MYRGLSGIATERERSLVRIYTRVALDNNDRIVNVCRVTETILMQGPRRCSRYDNVAEHDAIMQTTIVLCKKLANKENDVSKSAASIDRQRQCCQHKSRTIRYFHEQQRPVRLDKLFSHRANSVAMHATDGDDKLNFVSRQFTDVCRNVGLITCRML